MLISLISIKCNKQKMLLTNRCLNLVFRVRIPPKYSLTNLLNISNLDFNTRGLLILNKSIFCKLIPHMN